MPTPGAALIAAVTCVLAVGDAARVESAPAAELAATPAPGADSGLAPATAGCQASAAERGRKLLDEELTAHFVSEPLFRAKQALDADRPAEALRLLAREGEAPPVQFLRALSQLSLGHTESGAELLSGLAENYHPMRGECLARAGAAYEKLSRVLDAADAYARVAPNSARYSDAQQALSRLSMDRGEFEGALTTADALATAQPADAETRANAMLIRAAVAAARHDLAAERELLTAVYGEAPDAQVRIAGPRLRELGGVPALAAAQRALALIERRLVPQALAVALPGARKGSPDPVVCAERLAFGLVLEQRDRHAEAVEALSEAAKRCQGEPSRPRALLGLGIALAGVGSKDAVATFDRLLTEYPMSPLAARALAEAAEVDLANGELNAARARLGQVGTAFGGNEVAADALFRSFWLTWKADKAQADPAPLALTVDLAPGGATALQRERARYWWGRALQERGDLGGAASAYARLSRDARTSFYGRQALEQLAGLEPQAAQELASNPLVPSAGQRWPLYTGPEGDEPRLGTAIELARLGLPEAQGELAALARPGVSAERRRLLFELMRLSGDDARAGAYARQSVREHLGEWAPEDGPMLAAAFPRPYADLVDKHAATAGIDRWLLQALIREESAFNPRARSWAGALGLAQLMVPTAREVAHQLRAPWTGPAALYEPDFNLKLGARYLANVLKRFEGNQFYALASYNAGPNRVSSWLKSGPPVPMDEWVEDIPVDETRWYVKRVLSSASVYQRLLETGRLTRAEGPADPPTRLALGNRLGAESRAR